MLGIFAASAAFVFEGGLEIPSGSFPLNINRYKRLPGGTHLPSLVLATLVSFPI